MSVEKKSSSGEPPLPLKPMPTPPMKLPADVFATVQSHIEGTLENGKIIRSTLETYSNTGPFNADWEVEAAVEALHVFGSRWTIEILATLYITGPRRFNEMKGMLSGISSRTLSDKLRFLADEGLVLRLVNEGPPIKVSYELSEHGLTCGRLLSPLVAHLKVEMGSVQVE